MGIWPAILKVWVYTVLFALLALVGLVGAIVSRRPSTKGALGACCILALVALATGYITGFTFHLNRVAPVSTDSLVYLVPNCLCGPDTNVQTDLEAVHVRDGQVAWRHPIREGGFGPSDTFISDEQHVYLEQYSLDATHLGEDVITALDAHSGHQVWQVTTPIGGRLVSAAQGRLVLSDPQTTLILDTSTGKELAEFPGGNAVLEWNRILYTSSGYNDVITVTATNEVTGHHLWTSGNVFGGSLAMTPGVIIASGQDVLTAIRVSDGSRLWQVNDGPGSGPPLIIGDTVFTGITTQGLATAHGFIIARLVSDGALLWKKTMGQFPVLYSVAENVVLATKDTSAADTAIIALGAGDGAQLWSFPATYGSPVVLMIVDGVVILRYESSREIVALDVHSGSIYWQTSL